MINLSAYLRICLSIEDFMYLSSNIVKVGAHFECTDQNAYSPGRGEDTRMVHIVGISISCNERFLLFLMMFKRPFQVLNLTHFCGIWVTCIYYV